MYCLCLLCTNFSLKILFVIHQKNMMTIASQEPTSSYKATITCMLNDCRDVFPDGSKLPATNLPTSAAGPVQRFALVSPVWKLPIWFSHICFLWLALHSLGYAIGTDVAYFLWVKLSCHSYVNSCFSASAQQPFAAAIPVCVAYPKIRYSEIGDYDVGKVNS